MSFGSYQPFNPTANRGSIGIGNSGSIGGGNSGMPVQGITLPGAQDPNNQQYFQQANESHQELGQALKNMQGQYGGGKNAGPGAPGGTFNNGSKYLTGQPQGPSIGRPAFQDPGMDQGATIGLPGGPNGQTQFPSGPSIGRPAFQDPGMRQINQPAWAIATGGPAQKVNMNNFLF